MTHSFPTRRSSDLSEIAERAVKVRIAADRCAKIVKTFLSMARQRPADRRPIHINRLVEEVLDLVTHQLSTTDVLVTCDLAPDLPPVAGDADPHSHVLPKIGRASCRERVGQSV